MINEMGKILYAESSIIVNNSNEQQQTIPPKQSVCMITMYNFMSIR